MLSVHDDSMVTPKSDFAKLPLIELQQFYDNGLEKIRIANTKRGHQLLIKELFKFTETFLRVIARGPIDGQLLNKSEMEKERDALMARNVCMIFVAATVLMQFVLIAKFL